MLYSIVQCGATTFNDNGRAMTYSRNNYWSTQWRDAHWVGLVQNLRAPDS